MKDGFIKVATGQVPVSVADPSNNADEIIKVINLADDKGVHLLVLPELCVTGYTCGDLFYNQLLLDGALSALKKICEETADLKPVTVLGLPVSYLGKLYNCAAVISGGNILGFVPQAYPDGKQFTSGLDLPENGCKIFEGEEILIGLDQIFQHELIDDFCFAVEVGNDYSAPVSPAVDAVCEGATIIAVPAASPELVGASEFQRTMLTAASARLNAGYIFCGASSSESTQDMVFSGQTLIAENGKLLKENKFSNDALTITEIDINLLQSERRKNKKFITSSNGYFVHCFNQPIEETVLTRHFDENPFITPHSEDMDARAEAILSTQAYGLKKRLSHTFAKRAVIGISGGLDSTLALLVAIRTMKLLNRPATDILAITMPCFGTSSRTKTNATALCEELGVELKEINIAASVRQHFMDISHNEADLDVTYENAQARERTQVLMDVANQCGGMVIGTGDLSELALGWATYNGDHMSMYGVNASIPKTLVRYLVRYEALRASDKLKKTLLDIIDTPVSPELLPTDENGQLSQKTEDLVGPYELHDFFLYYFLRYGFAPEKILRLTKYVLGNRFDEKTIEGWLKIFLRRFFNQQFKRSCLPDGPKVGTVSLSPRGDWQMPSDAASALWLK